MSTDPVSLAASSVATGVGAVTVAAFGLPPQVLVYAAIGAAVGVILSKPTTVVRVVFIFAGMVLFAALGATLFAKTWFDGDPEVRNFAALMGAPLYPVAQAFLIDKAPAALDRVWSAIRGRK